MLTLRYSQRETVEIIGHGNLTGKAAVFRRTFGKLQQAVFHAARLGHAGPVDPRSIDMHMAGRAGALAPAIAVDARHTVVDRRIPRGRAALDRDGKFGAVRLDENDCGHFLLLSIMLDETAGESFP